MTPWVVFRFLRGGDDNKSHPDGGKIFDSGCVALPPAEAIRSRWPPWSPNGASAKWSAALAKRVARSFLVQMKDFG